MNVPPPSSKQRGQWLIEMLNQVFEIEKKLGKIEEKNSIQRNIDRIKMLFDNESPDAVGLKVDNPLGESYDETRIDLDASISGEGVDNLKVIEVIKPIIRQKRGKTMQLVQKGVVIVESQKK